MRCFHVHFWGTACEVTHLHTFSGTTFTVDCRCKKGVSRSLAGLLPGRPPIPDRVRRAVIDRDGDKCCFCGRRCLTGGRAKRYPKHRLTLDHIIPYSKGGADTVENLRVACLSCNIRRGIHDEMPLRFA
jgi:hypothetical protein